MITNYMIINNVRQVSGCSADLPESRTPSWQWLVMAVDDLLNTASAKTHRKFTFVYALRRD